MDGTSQAFLAHSGLAQDQQRAVTQDHTAGSRHERLDGWALGNEVAEAGPIVCTLGLKTLLHILGSTLDQGVESLA